MERAFSKYDSPKLYSPGQVMVSACLGTPVLGLVLLWVNFKALGQGKAAKWTVILGLLSLVFVAALLGMVLLFWPILPVALGYVLCQAVIFLLVAKVTQEKAFVAYLAQGGSQVTWLRTLATGVGVCFVIVSVSIMFNVALRALLIKLLDLNYGYGA